MFSNVPNDQSQNLNPMRVGNAKFTKKNLSMKSMITRLGNFGNAADAEPTARCQLTLKLRGQSRAGAHTVGAKNDRVVLPLAIVHVNIVAYALAYWLCQPVLVRTLHRCDALAPLISARAHSRFSRKSSAPTRCCLAGSRRFSAPCSLSADR